MEAQYLDLETIGKGKAFKIGGSLSSNNIFYNSNQKNSRENFTYFLQGNLNVGFYQFSMPISYSFSNQGNQFNYEIPFKFNRLSLHPKYKWIQAHIGDVAMNFSPFTLSGHQFTGGGIELTPGSNFTISAMYGRLLKAIENNDDPRTIPAFSRFGYGLKLGFKKKKYKIGAIGFYAKDIINSISAVPDDQNITPKENLVVSIEGSYAILENLELKGEYASTAITQDTRSESAGIHRQSIASMLFRNRGSTEYYSALKTELIYRFNKHTIGARFERIDPGYKTLGAYFFNNDFENITIISSTTLFADKLNLSFNIGYQRDNLANQKKQATRRAIGSINASFNVSKILNISASYSNFSTYTNAKVNQFDVINDDNILDNVTDALNYKQISQNANVNVNYIVSAKKDVQQNLNVNYSVADVSNNQGGIVRIGGASTFHNAYTSYTLGFPKKSLNITVSVNGTINTIGRDNITTWGPTLSVNKKLLAKKLNMNFGSSYNTSSSISQNTSIYNFRTNASYVFKEKHSFNLNGVWLFRKLASNDKSELTITFGYNYSF